MRFLSDNKRLSGTEYNANGKSVVKKHYHNNMPNKHRGSNKMGPASSYIENMSLIYRERDIIKG